MSRPAGVGVGGVVSALVLIVRACISDFSVVNVFKNSHSMKPLLYKIATADAAMGADPGAVRTLVAAFATISRCHCVPCAPHALIAAALPGLGHLKIRSSAPRKPAARPQPRAAGHPPPHAHHDAPRYVGFSISTCGRRLMKATIDPPGALGAPVDAGAWIPHARHRDASYWAYYEAGWGGWWFWDTVENASAMPSLPAPRCCIHHRDGEARCEGLDHAAVDPAAFSHLPGAFGV